MYLRIYEKIKFETLVAEYMVLPDVAVESMLERCP